MPRKYNRLAELREERKLTQKEVAKLLDTTESGVSYHENGIRGLSDDMISKYAALYKVRSYQLFFNLEEINAGTDPGLPE